MGSVAERETGISFGRHGKIELSIGRSRLDFDQNTSTGSEYFLSSNRTRTEGFGSDAGHQPGAMAR